MSSMPSTEEVREALRAVIDPELRRSIVELDMVRSIQVHDSTGVVDVTVSLTTAGCPIRNHFEDGVAQAVRGLDGVSGVNVDFDVLTDQQKSALQQRLGRGSLPEGALAAIGNIVCVASGKGGVGKSTLTANLAGALVADLPPGTGDVGMARSPLLPQSRFVIVPTPQAAAQKVARRAAEMAGKFDLEIAGVLENMAGFTTPAGERYPIFGEGGGQLLADELDVPLLAKVPLTMPLREQADAGPPLVLADPDDPAAQAIRHAAGGPIAASPVELPMMQAPAPAAAPKPAGASLPMA